MQCKRVIATAAVVLGAIGAPPVFAESSLEEIVVTATRGEKTLAEVPQAVGVVNQDDLQLGRQELGIDEALMRIPGLFMQNRYNFTQDLRVSIRGSGTRATFGIRGIKIYIDGIPATTTDGQGGVDDIDMGSAQRIEVIRGPSSALYGSAAGGVISIFTEDGPETPFVEAGATIGEYDMQKYQLKAGGQTGNLNYLVNASHLGMDGYRDHSAVDHWLINSKFRYDFSADTDLTMIANFVRSPVADDPGGLTEDLVKQDPRQAYTNNLLYDAGEALEQKRLGFVLRHAIDANQEITIHNFYVWRDFKTFLPLGGSGVSAFKRLYLGGGGQYDLTGQLFGLPNHFTAGVDVDAQRDDRSRYDNLFGVEGPLTLSQDEDAESYGIYMRNELSITDTVEVSVGVRYDIVDMAVNDKFLVNGDQSLKLNFDEVSPSAGIVWHPMPELNLYANYGRAFETPTFTELGGAAQDFGNIGIAIGGFNNVTAQTADSFEIGARGRLMDRVDYELAFYTMQVDNEVTNVATLGDRGVFENADTDRQGVEAGIVVDLMEGLRLTTSYTYSDFKFDRFPSDPTLVGNRLPSVPKHLVYNELAYTHESGFYIIGDVLWVDDYFADNANTAVNPSYAVATIRLGRDFDFGNLRLSPFLGVNNLFDEKYNGNVRPNSFGGRYFEPAPDRNVYGGLTARYSF